MPASADHNTPTPLQRRIPNALTVSRLVLTAVFVVLLALYDFPARAAWALPAALLVFVVAVLTDALDGFLARRWNAVTVFGRVVDPAADKVLVLGALVYLASPTFDPPAGFELARVVSGVEPWMVVLILARELMVTSIRAVLESSHVSFAANRAGKVKMIFQSLVAPVVMGLVWLAPTAALDAGGWARWTIDLAVWATVAVTVLSSLPYGLGLLTHMATEPAKEQSS